MTDYPTLLYTSTCEIPTLFNFIAEAWERYPFRAEPPRIGHYRLHPPPPPLPGYFQCLKVLGSVCPSLRLCKILVRFVRNGNKSIKKCSRGENLGSFCLLEHYVRLLLSSHIGTQNRLCRHCIKTLKVCKWYTSLWIVKPLHSISHYDSIYDTLFNDTLFTSTVANQLI